MSYWYLAHDNELLLDIDDYTKPTKRGIWGDVIFRQRLRDAINAGKFRPLDVFIFDSMTPGHFHVFIRLDRAMALMERMIWQLRLGSDTARAHSDLMRAFHGHPYPSLLIRHTKAGCLDPTGKFRLYRKPDVVCPCSTKHNTGEQAKLLDGWKPGFCPVWEKYRGATPWELFGRPEHLGIERPVNLPTGRVPLDIICLVGEVKTKKEKLIEAATASVIEDDGRVTRGNR